jgi:hypothetical protein
VAGLATIGLQAFERPVQPGASPSGGASDVRAATLQPLSFEPAGNGAETAFLWRTGAGFGRVGPTGVSIARPGVGADASPVGFRLVGADPGASGSGAGPVTGWSNYYRGADRSAWRERVPNYGRVEYPGVYPGVTLAYHGERAALEFDALVAPGADPRQVRLAFDGSGEPRLESSGDVVLGAPGGALRLHRPVAYQEGPRGREPVAAAFDLDGAAGTLGFRLGAYDATRPLVIDPVITYADYLGGSDDDTGLAIAVDPAGNRYVTGTTRSLDFESPGTPTRVSAGIDAFVIKLAPDGTRLYTSYFGGSTGDTTPLGIAVSATGEAHIAGETDSQTLPDANNGLQLIKCGSGGAAGACNNSGGKDAFVARFAAATGVLDYSTFIGGASDDTAQAIALDTNDNIYIGGSTRSGDFPTQDPFQANLRGTGDGFVAKINADGLQLVYSSYLGGSGADNVWAIAVDPSSQAYVAGSTASDNLAEGSVVDDRLKTFHQLFDDGTTDGYVAKLTSAGDQLAYFSYIGGTNFDRALGVAIDADLNVYVTGFTASNFDFPGAASESFGGGPFDAFVAKLNPEGSDLVYSTFIGGDGDDEGLGIAVDGPSGVAVVAGQTSSGDFPLAQPFQNVRLGSGRNAFITQLAANGQTRPFSSYLGGTGDDYATSVAIGPDGLLHVAGIATSDTLPLVGGSQGERAGGRDGFVLAIDASDTEPVPELHVAVSADPQPTPENKILDFAVTVDNQGGAAATGVFLKVSGTNTVGIDSTGCGALADGILCPVPDIPAGGSVPLAVQLRPDTVGNASLTATVVRADQSGISDEDNTDTFTKLVVDTSGNSGALGWELLALAALLLALGRRGACRA